MRRRRRRRRIEVALQSAASISSCLSLSTLL
jgi:hypothetical protein